MLNSKHVWPEGLMVTGGTINMSGQKIYWWQVEL